MSDIISTNREVDAACAAALGRPWCRPTHGRCCTCQDCGWDYDHCQCGYSGDPEKARLLEDEIERRGLQSEYVFALAESLFGEQDEWGTAHVWKMIFATPELRARAFLQAINL